MSDECRFVANGRYGASMALEVLGKPARLALFSCSVQTGTRQAIIVRQCPVLNDCTMSPGFV